MTEHGPGYGQREENTRPWDYNRIVEHGRIVKELKANFGAVELPQRPQAGFAPREEQE